MKKWLEIAVHLAFWLFFLWMLYTAFALESVEIRIENGVEQEIYTRAPGLLSSMLIVLTVKALFFYGAVGYIIPEYFEKKQWWVMLFQLGLLFLACQVIERGLHRLMSDQIVTPPIGINVLLYLLFLSAAFAYRLSKDWWRNERLRARLAEEKLTAELNYLKAQLNPHFLFNTLNNLYALAEREGNAPLSEGIAGLAELMRYAVYDSRADYVPLAKELHFLQSMVEMQSLRLDEEDEVDIVFRISGEYDQLSIAPLLLVPFVENAFKHGIRYGRRSSIRIQVEVAEASLHFQVSNTLHSQAPPPHKERTGVGLENARRRLQLLYPNRHRLEAQCHGNTYLANLQLELDVRMPG
ncbi:MAG: histidine kinase [Phaeodactylibacter sp.]|nr:histidine kinase [Phaeodactylibacter sp.]MCB9048077.1 histidine kinase [Lewinellaceae bacterium]